MLITICKLIRAGKRMGVLLDGGMLFNNIYQEKRVTNGSK